MYAPERQQAIVDLVNRLGRVSVTKLADDFQVTAETIRRDMDALEAAGAICRVHGGAIPVNAVRKPETRVDDREATHLEAKQAIARAALRLVPDHEDATILLDSGTTTARLAQLLPPGRLRTVVTNSVPIASFIAAHDLAQVQLVGGRVRGLTLACVGADTVADLQRLSVNTVFLGTNGFSAHRGFTTPDPSEAAVKAAMLHCGHRVVVLADSSKINTDYLVCFADIDDVDVVVTDSAVSQAQVQQLQNQGIEVGVA